MGEFSQHAREAKVDGWRATFAQKVETSLKRLDCYVYKLGKQCTRYEWCPQPAILTFVNSSQHELRSSSSRSDGYLELGMRYQSNGYSPGKSVTARGHRSRGRCVT
eukprot:1473834-Pleurochrysis_carterae.AAC.1